jgi:L-aspartate oxidase
VPDPARRPLIVGSGIAGFFVALRAREAGLDPTIVTKATLDESNTRYAQGGIAAAIGPDDSSERHLEDTIRAGDGLVDRDAARALVEEAPRRIADLVRLGVPFDTVHGQISLGREAAHSRARVLHAGGDATGLRIEETLKRRAVEAGVEVREKTALRRLAVGREGNLRAALTRDGESAVEWVEDRPIVLATGGAGSLYRQSSNPAVATGEGFAIAFRAGCELADMEFVQFHPTAFYREGAPRFLITEALRGEGARLVNARGERFLPRYHRDAELAPRDVVSRAIQTELERTRTDRVYLDATAIPRDRLLTRFPTICHFLEDFALDPSRDRIPVTPVAHYTIGGVATDLEGRSSLRGLLAAGEVAATGVHGANRLASNSLLEGLVFGERVVRQLIHPTPGGPTRVRRRLAMRLHRGRGEPSAPAGAVDEIRDLLWDRVGIVRSGRGLRGAVRRLEAILRAFEPSDPDALPGRVANAALTALLIARAALAREESRGAHYRSDFPRTVPRWRLHLGVRRAIDGDGATARARQT